MSLEPNVRAQLEQLIGSDEVVLFMKGSRTFPQCGFSATVVQILNTLVPKYTTVNVLSDPGIRDGIKAFSDWPTIPQLYVRGEFVGGCDIVKQLHGSGELAGMLGADTTAPEAPAVTVTEAAAAVLKGALGDSDPGDVIHVRIDDVFRHNLEIGPKVPTSATVQSHGITLQFDRLSAERAAGLSIDYVDTAEGTGFKMDNPQRPPEVMPIGAVDLKAKLDRGEIRELIDVRTPAERERANVKGSKLLDEETVKYLEGLPKDTPLAFMCHHGSRSQAAAEHFRELGFRTVYNLSGGIDAWSQTVDSSVPRY